ncbi:hypothetical protein R1flu_000363 [Riccia fluitans]|uniref:F-box domain-containing protein n=1 Tax=Riccia fluitans TaxID=41844 RepID=A0ABD1Y077_9MARC
MDSLPEDIWAHILQRLKTVKDRNTAASVCRRWFYLDRVLRRELSVGCGMDPPEAAIGALTTRFTNLSKLEICYFGWHSDMGKQADDKTLKILSQNCLQLTDLSLNFCGFITDTGMGHLTLCRELKSIRLNFLPCVSGRGLLSLVTGCKALTRFHVEWLMGVRTVEWLEFIGRKGRIKSLAVKNCKCVGDYELGRLGRRGWQNLREFFFAIDLRHGSAGNIFGHNGREASLLNAWRMFDGSQELCCPNLQVLHLVKTLSASRTGLNWLLPQCSSLRELHLDTCIGLEDEDLVLLARQCPELSSVYFRAPIHLPGANPSRLTDVGLLAIARSCPNIESIELAFHDSDLSPFITSAGITSMVETCLKLRSLTISAADPFTDDVMIAVCKSGSIESLELDQCREITDAGLKMARESSLKELKVRSCGRLSDTGFAPLKHSRKLKCLVVNSCPLVSRGGLIHAAQVVIYNGTLS